MTTGLVADELGAPEAAEHAPKRPQPGRGSGAVLPLLRLRLRLPELSPPMLMPIATSPSSSASSPAWETSSAKFSFSGHSDTVVRATMGCPEAPRASAKTEKTTALSLLLLSSVSTVQADGGMSASSPHGSKPPGSPPGTSAASL